MDIRTLSRQYAGDMINLRREFHQHPELSCQEFETSKRIQRELDKIGIPYNRVADTGVVAIIKGRKPGGTVALRADMDALEITEMTSAPYKSRNTNTMHACGHDAHMAMLIGAARILHEKKEQIRGTVKLIFQPAEEIAEGAKRIISAGVMKGVDGVCAIHVWSDLPSGMISLEEGFRMAAADIFTITITGKGGHGALPHQCIDSVVVGSSIVMNIQTLVSRMVDPFESAVVTIGTFDAGTGFNVIAGEAVLKGTARFYAQETGEILRNGITRVVENTAHIYGARAELEYIQAVHPVINDRRCSQIAQNSAKRLGLENNIRPMEKATVGEDFSEYQKYAPGILVFLGVRNEEKGIIHPHHHESFDIDEDVLEMGAAFYAQYAVDFLTQSEG